MYKIYIFLFLALFSRALQSVNIRDLITNVGSASAAPAAGGAAVASADTAAAEKSKYIFAYLRSLVETNETT